MERLAPFHPEEEDIDAWIERFELWATLEKKAADTWQSWCRLLVGLQAESTLKLLAPESTYAAVKARLLEQLGERRPQQEALRKLATLEKGNLSCRELACQATRLAQVVLTGAPEAVMQ